MRNNKLPLVSIVMPVYNAGNFLHEAIDSLLAQTYKNWELICVDDRSQDNSLSILKRYAKTEKRIRVYRNMQRRRVANTANLAISKARGQFIARMDADDVSLPTRIEKQVRFLLRHPSITLVGGQYSVINSCGKLLGKRTLPAQHQDIYRMIYRSIPIAQPTIMVNTKLLPRGFSWYQKDQEVAEEVEFLFRIFQFGRCANLSSYILKYRVHENNTSLLDPKKTFLRTYEARRKATKEYGYRPGIISRAINYLEWAVIKVLPKPAIYPFFLTLSQFPQTLSSLKFKVKLAPFSRPPAFPNPLARSGASTNSNP